MPGCLHSINIENFKAFREFCLNLEGRHLLIYGSNGSGKSSLYWALYTFLQSAQKDTPDVSKYFDSANPQNLLNIHEQGEANPKPGAIALTLRDTSTKIETTYRIDLTNHGTKAQPVITKGDLSSDFITYRFFFGFSDFRNSEKFDIWPLFEKEILPFCVSTGGTIPLESWNAIKVGNPNPRNRVGFAGSDAYSAFRKKVVGFATVLPGIIDSISRESQKFYDKYFANDDPAKITLKLAVTTKPSVSGSSKKDFKFTKPIIEFGIQIDGETINKPQTFLNEAKLTQFALSVRFAASLVNLHESDLKLLVLDDILVSLDMSNRMKVVEILQSESFRGYQQIIMTHDRGLFNEVRRQIQNNNDWLFVTLSGNSHNGINSSAEKSPLQKAKDYFYENKLDEAAQHLRIAAEENVKNYWQVTLNQNLTEGFTPLSKHMKSIRNHVEGNLLQRCIHSLEQDEALEFSEEDKQKAETLKIIKALEKMKDRVLNPAAHHNEVPLYEAEVEKTLDLIKQLESKMAEGGI